MSDDPVGVPAHGDYPPSTAINGIPDIVIERLLGRGGMGLVYAARHLKHNIPLALKVARPLEGCTRNHLASLVHEAQVMTRLNHRHIVRMHDFGCQDDLVWIAMERIEGHSLRHLMRTQPIPVTVGLGIIRQLCQALEHMHTRGVIHQDLKPENILIDCNLQATIIDFGLARVRGLSYTISRPGRVSGTLRYMAPEQRLHPRDIDSRIDVYALGVIMHELFTGERPTAGAPLDLSHLGSALTTIVHRCLQSNPNDRWQSASELLAALQALAPIADETPTIVWLATDPAINGDALQEAGSSTSLFS